MHKRAPDGELIRDYVRSKEMKLNILHEDGDIIVAVKPCGVPTQPDKTNSESMVRLGYMRERTEKKNHTLCLSTDWTGRLAE